MKINQFLLAMVVVAAAVAVTVYGADVTLIEDGQSRCVIRVSPRVMAADREVPSEAAQEQDRRRLRESVRDLAHALEKMSGAAVSISTGGSAAGGNRAILIGEVAQDAFGPVGITVFGGQGCRVVGQQARIGVYGESDLGSSYAIYDVLHELGCRWYMPGDLGEVIPAQDHRAAPSETRACRRAPSRAASGTPTTPSVAATGWEALPIPPAMRSKVMFPRNSWNNIPIGTPRSAANACCTVATWAIASAGPTPRCRRPWVIG